MIDTKRPLRIAYYAALNGHLTYMGMPVPIGDEETPVTPAANLYVIIAMQSSVQENTFQSWGSNETLVLDIVDKTSLRGAKEKVDQVTAQILAILFPDPINKGVSGLPAQPGIQINCPVFSDDRYISLSLNSSNTVMRRLLTFKHHVLQTQ